MSAGGGVGGLVTAAKLGQQGYRVTLLEQNQQVVHLQLCLPLLVPMYAYTRTSCMLQYIKRMCWLAATREWFCSSPACTRPHQQLAELCHLVAAGRRSLPVCIRQWLPF